MINLSKFLVCFYYNVFVIDNMNLSGKVILNI